MNKKIKEELGIDVFDLKPLHDLQILHTLNGEKHEVTGHYFIAKTRNTLADIKLTK